MKQLQASDSVDSITTILQEQARIFREFRGDDGKLVKSLKSSVDILYKLSVSTVLGEGVSLVRSNHSSGFPVSYRRYAAIPACKSNIRWHRHLTCRMSPSPIPSACPVTSKSRRRSKTLALATMRSWICLRPSRAS
jgi:hypothetical protein